MEATVKRTTYKVSGSHEPCFEVSKAGVLVRIAPFYHYYKTTIMISEYLDGEFNSCEEWDLTFDYLEELDALEIAKNYSVYLR